MTRVAAVDCGTNTIKLLVADVDPETGVVEDRVREMRIVRLGQDVDRTGRLATAALERVFAAAEEFATTIEAHGVQALRFVATSAVRDADNAQDFAAGIQQRLRVRPEVVSGEVEARLAYEGATRSLAAGAGPALDAPVVVVDIGGGSTELVLGGDTGPRHEQGPASPPTVRASCSLDIGSVRVSERLLPSDPPTRDEVAAAVTVVDEALDSLPSAGIHLDEAHTLVGVAGTVTTIAMLLLDLEAWDRDRVHGSSYPVHDVHTMTERLLGHSVAERERAGVPRGRSDVIGAGALILDRVLRRCPVERLVVSDSDILDGIAWSVASEGR